MKPRPRTASRDKLAALRESLDASTFLTVADQRKQATLWVLDSSSNGIGLTLITCYPFNYLGFAPEWFVVQAERLADGE